MIWKPDLSPDVTWLVEWAEILDSKLGFILAEPLSYMTLVKAPLSHQTPQLQGCVQIRDDTWHVPSLLLAHCYSNKVTMMTMAILVRLTVVQATLALHLQHRLNSDPSAKR